MKVNYNVMLSLITFLKFCEDGKEWELLGDATSFLLSNFIEEYGKQNNNVDDFNFYSAENKEMLSSYLLDIHPEFKGLFELVKSTDDISKRVQIVNAMRVNFVDEYEITPIPLDFKLRKAK